MASTALPPALSAADAPAVIEAGPVTTNSADLALHGTLARVDFGVDGRGITIGIISDSFDTFGTKALPARLSNDLPAGGVTVLADYAGSGPSHSGATDEGRGMAELIHRIAPGAGIAFATSTVTINDPNAGIGSGSVFGHALDGNASVIGAIAAASTPYFGTTPAREESTSSVGLGQLRFNQTGTVLASPQTLAKVDFSAADGVNTEWSASVTPASPAFFGTSAAAPDAAAVAALMLQANPTLTPAQVTAMLKSSAVTAVNSAGSADVAAPGAGLIEADAAVKLAVGGLGGAGGAGYVNGGGTVFQGGGGGIGNHATGAANGPSGNVAGAGIVPNLSSGSGGIGRGGGLYPQGGTALAGCSFGGGAGLFNATPAADMSPKCNRFGENCRR
jgi:hypothetical protein